MTRVAILLALALTFCVGPACNGGLGSATGSGGTASVSQNLTPFVGDWSGYGSDATIAADGRLILDWRTNRLCGQTSPPCDRIVNGLITGGGHAIATMRAVGDRSGVGRVRTSTDLGFAPLGSFTADVTPYQLLTLRFVLSTVSLCGKSFGALAPPHVHEARPCGG